MFKEILDILDFAFQPIVNIRSGKIYAVEALLRNYKEAGYSTIFSLFDDLYARGYLYRFDLKLRKKALEKFKKINIKNLILFYNLDNRISYAPDYSYGNTLKILENLNLCKKQICFELSERDTVKDPLALLNLVNRYSQEGFNIAIDDFGTGIAGLKLLYYTEPSFIKIDRFFIEKIDTDHKKNLFCKSIINMAHMMGIKVIVEGVETKEEYFTCKDIGADFIQGYFIQKPTLNVNEIQKKYIHIKELFVEDKREDLNLIKKDYIEKIEPLNINSSLYDVFVYFKRNPKNYLVPIVNDINELCGVIYEEDVKPFSYSPFGMSIAQNKNSNLKVKELIKEAISVEYTWDVDKLLEIYNLYGEGSKGVFVLKNGKYFGFINLQNIIKISYEKNLRIANDLNPLTKLPGNKKIDEFIDEVFNKKEKSYMIYFDFNNFKPFNDYYGFRRGDRVIILFSEMLKKVFNDFFVFHIGGDDFFVGCKGAEFEEVLKRVKIIVEKFNKEVVNFYSKEDKKRGFIEIEDRYGIKRRFEFLNLSTLILEISSVSNKENFEDLLGKAKIYSKKFNCFAISIL